MWAIYLRIALCEEQIKILSYRLKLLSLTISFKFRNTHNQPHDLLWVKMLLYVAQILTYGFKKFFDMRNLTM